MVPVRTGLTDREAVGEGFARRDPVEAEAGDAVLVEREEEAVPVDRADLVEVVRDVDHGILPLTQPQQRSRDRTADHGRVGMTVVNVESTAIDRKTDFDHVGCIFTRGVDRGEEIAGSKPEAGAEGHPGCDANKVATGK